MLALASLCVSLCKMDLTIGSPHGYAAPHASGAASGAAHACSHGPNREPMTTLLFVTTFRIS